jgi:hypothetical protein
MKLTRAQMEASLLRDEDALVADVVEYFEEMRPHIIAAYPPGYLIAILRESVRLAIAHNMTDVEHIRLFVDLRWEIAAGWFREPDLNEVLMRKGLTPERRFEVLTGSKYDAAWDRAEALDGPEEWRGPLWQEAWE